MPVCPVGNGACVQNNNGGGPQKNGIIKLKNNVEENSDKSSERYGVPPGP